MRVPNFFIIGAPKCGTTTLSKWLGWHPRIFVSTPKEPHYFNFDMGNRDFCAWDAYIDLFARANSTHLAVGEASTWYLYSAEAVNRIENEIFAPRYIVMFRDQVSMVKSLYMHNVRHLHEDASSVEVAWDLQLQRREGRSVPKRCRTAEFLQYSRACAVGSMIKRLFSSVPHERVWLVSMDDLKEDPRGVYREILSFLGVPDDGRSEFPTENPSRVPRSFLLQRFLMSGGRVKKALGIRRSFGLLKFNERRASVEVQSRFEERLRKHFMEDELLLRSQREAWALRLGVSLRGSSTKA